MNTAYSSAQKGAQWLLDRLQPDGSIVGGAHLNAYYKLPCALAAAGHPVEAEQVLDYVTARFLQPGGDLDGEGVPWFDQFRIYPHAWLAYTAASRGRWELVRPLLAYLVRAHHPDSGAFAARADHTEEIMTTAMAGIASLWCGRIDLARGVAEWLERIWVAQPDIRRGLYHVWHPGKGLAIHFPEDKQVWFQVDAERPKQWYFQYGISAALLSQLTAATGEMRWLGLAQQYLHASQYCQPDVYRTAQAGKIGWGAAWTYRLTQAPEDAQLARTVVDGLLALQAADGSWNEPAYDTHTCIDVTAEMTALQAAIGMVLHV